MNPPAGTAHPVCQVGELPPGERKIVEIAGRSIGVFRLEDGRFFALRNRCPHRGAPLCLGRLMGLVTADRPYQRQRRREGEILRCPWHGWEFDLTNGKSVFMPERVRVKSYPVEVEKAPETTVERFKVTEDAGMVVVWAGD